MQKIEEGRSQVSREESGRKSGEVKRRDENKSESVRERERESECRKIEREFLKYSKGVVECGVEGVESVYTGLGVLSKGSYL